MQIIDQLRSKIEKEGLSVSKVSKDTGIESHRLYKWVQGKASPKHDDIKTLQSYIDGKTEIVRRGEPTEAIIGSVQERLLRIEAHLEVYESAIAGLLSQDKKDFTKRVGELREAVQGAVSRRFSELNKR
jgi:predicted nuclease with TOPRIM domain